MKITIEHAKNISITIILDKLNIHPTKENEKEALYLSPLRKEETASFQVDKVENRWCDLETGEEGDIIDFAQKYLEYTGEDCTQQDALRWLGNMGNGMFHTHSPVINDLPHPDEQPKFILKSKEEISDFRLLRYLESRGIPLDIAKIHLKQVVALNTKTDKKILALGLRNENGGFEISNRIFKSSLKDKDISVIRGTDPTSGVLHIYEGKMDFLSVLARLKTQKIRNDVIVLNSLSMLENTKDHIRAFAYKTVYSWFDNDSAGNIAKQSLQEFLNTMPRIVHIPMNVVYKEYKDVNEWHVANPITSL